MLHMLMRSVSMWSYKQVLRDIADRTDVSESKMSREFVEASEKSFHRIMGCEQLMILFYFLFNSFLSFLHRS